MAENTGLNVEIGVTLNRLASQLAQVEAKMAKAAKSGEQSFVTSNTRAAASFSKIDKAAAVTNSRLGALGNVSRQTRAQIQNVGYQVQDIAVQIAGGQGAIRALSQQIPQLASGFGIMGVAIGTVASISIPLLALAFSGASEEAETLDDRIKSLGDAIDNFSKSVDASNKSGEELAKKYTTLGAEAQKALDAIVKADRLAAVAALNKEINALSETFGGLTVAADGVSGGELESTLMRLRDELGLTGEEAVKVTQAMTNLATAKGPTEIAQRANELRDALLAAGVAADNDLVKGLNNAAVQAAALQSKIDEIPTAIDQIIAGINLATGALGGMEAAAGNVYTRMLDVATAAYEAAKAIAQANANRQRDSALAYGKLQNTYGSGPDAARASVSKLNAPSSPLGGNPTYSSPAARSSSGGGGGGSKTAFDPFAKGQEQIQQLQQQLDLIGKSAEQIATLTAQYELLNAAKAAGLDLDARSAETGLTLRDSISAQAAQIGALTVKYQMAKDQADFFQGIQQQLTDGFIDAIVEGQNFAGVLADVAKQLAKALLQAALFGQGPLTGLFGGSQGVGLLSGLIKGFDEGGYTGDGGRLQPAGVVHKGEYVFDAAATRKIGVQRLEALRSGLKGYANGGLVGATPAPSVNVAAPGVQVVVIDSQEKFGEYLASNPRAEREVLKIVKRGNG